MILPDCCYEYRYEAPKAKIANKCDICGEDIYEGETYYEIFDENICENCIKECRRYGEIK